MSIRYYHKLVAYFMGKNSEKGKTKDALSKEIEEDFAGKDYASLAELLKDERAEGYVKYNSPEYIKAAINCASIAAQDDQILKEFITKLNTSIKAKKVKEIIICLNLINDWLESKKNSKSEDGYQAIRFLFIFARISMIKIQGSVIRNAIWMNTPKGTLETLDSCLQNIEKNSKKLLGPQNTLQEDFQEIYGDINKEDYDEIHFKTLEDNLQRVIELKELHAELELMDKEKLKTNLPTLFGFNPKNQDKINLFDSLYKKLEDKDAIDYWKKYKEKHINDTTEKKPDKKIKKPIKKLTEFRALLEATKKEISIKADQISHNNPEFTSKIMSAESKDLQEIKTQVRAISLIFATKQIMSSYIKKNDTFYMRFLVFIGNIPLFKTDKAELFKKTRLANTLLTELSKSHNSPALNNLLENFKKFNEMEVEQKKENIQKIIININDIKSSQNNSGKQMTRVH